MSGLPRLVATKPALAGSTIEVVPEQLSWPITPRERPVGMTLTLTPPAAPPVPAVRPQQASMRRRAQQSPLTEVQHTRRNRALAASAVLTGLVSVTTAALVLVFVIVGSW